MCRDNAVDQVVTATTALFGADAAGLMLLDEHGQLHMVAVADLHTDPRFRTTRATRSQDR